MVNIKTLRNPDDLAETAAKMIVAIAEQAVSDKNSFTIALSGGSTPKLLYALLANSAREFREQMPWTRTLFFWSDERFVPADHPDSNYRMTHEAMLKDVPVPASNVHRFLTEMNDAESAASNYEQQLRDCFDNSLPRFDLILLGLGADGHTASIFPGTSAVSEVSRWAVAPWVEKSKSYRLTMTPPVLNNAAHVMFLVSGEDKADILNEVLRDHQAMLPAQLIKPTNGELTWLTDQPAASKLDLK